MSDIDIFASNSLSRFKRLRELAERNNGYIEPTLYIEEIDTIIFAFEKLVQNKGTTIVVPCKVGDTVYHVDTELNEAIEEYTISGIDHVLMNVVGNENKSIRLSGFSDKDIGKDIFFNRYDAEKKFSETIKLRK